MGQLARAYPGFRSMKRLGVFLLPRGCPSQGYSPSIRFAGALMERGTVRVKKCPWPGLEPGPFDPESSAGNFRSPRLQPEIIYVNKISFINFGFILR